MVNIRAMETVSFRANYPASSVELIDVRAYEDGTYTLHLFGEDAKDSFVLASPLELLELRDKINDLLGD